MSLPSFQLAVVAYSSIGLWCCTGVTYSSSTRTAAAASAASASPMLTDGFSSVSVVRPGSSIDAKAGCVA